MRLCLVGLFGLLLVVGACADGAAPRDRDALPPPTAARVAAIRQAMANVKRLFPAEGENQPGDWLVTHPERGQTFDQYIASDPNRPTKKRTTIYIQPLGTFSATDQKLLDATADLLGRWYNLPVKKTGGRVAG